MATYYKYAERSAESQINWAEIGKNMTDMLQSEVTIREEKKAAIDAASREFGEKLANPPQGEHKSANQWALEYGDNASQYMLMQDRLLKQGILKPKDYMVTRQNLMDGTKQAFNLTKEFQETFKMKMDRYKNGESQDLELFLNAQAEKFGDFTKSQLYINPTDGSVNVAMKEKKMIDGKEVFVMNQNPNEFTTISSLRNTIAGTYDKYDTNAVTTAFADSLGKEETASIVFGTLSKGGSITTVEDITSRTDLDADGKTVMFKFIDAENQMITAALENPYNRLSVLTNTKKFAPNGKQYTFTYDEADAKANPEKVLLKVDSSTGQPTPQFSEEQTKVSNEAMRTEVRAKYDYKKGIDPTAQAQLQERRAKTEGEMAREDMEKEAENFGRNLALLTTGTAAQKAQAARYFASIKGISGVEPTATGINIYEGSTALPYDFAVGGKESTPLELGGSIVKKLNREGLSEDVILRAMKKNLVGGTITKDAVGRIGGVATDYAAEVGEYASKKVNEGVVIDNPKKTKANLEASLKDLGFSVSGRSSGAFNQDDFITITAPNGKSKEFAIDTTGNNAEIANFIRENRDDKKAQEIFGSKIAGGGGAPR